MASGTDGHGGSGQQALDRFAQMMIERMEKMKESDWQQGLPGKTTGLKTLYPSTGIITERCELYLARG